MLVLTRKSNQSIMIGDDIEVSVLSIMGEKVRIGIQAPRNIPVFRKEVYLEIQQERGRELAADGGGPRSTPRCTLGGAKQRRPARRPRAGAQPITTYSVSNIATVTSTAVARSTSTSTHEAHGAALVRALDADAGARAGRPGGAGARGGRGRPRTPRRTPARAG